MKYIFGAFLLGLAYLVTAEPVALQNGRVVFEPPTGFRELTQQEISLKFSRGNPPSAVYANDDMSVSVSIVFSPAAVEPPHLEDLKSAMEQTLPRLIPNLTWVKREMVNLNGTTWVHFELTSSAIDTDIYNHMYMTSFDGKMLGFNFNSTKGKYPAYSHQLEKSFQSIHISE